MKILVVDDHKLFRNAFIRLLGTCVSCPIFCDQAQNGLEALAKLHNGNFDLAFLDVNMPEMDGLETCRRLEIEQVRTPIIVLTQFYNENLIFHFFKLGVSSFLTKGTSVEELKTAVDSVVSGKKYFPVEVDKVIQKILNKQDFGCLQRIDLTHQEKQLLRYLQEGLTSKEIAREMNLTDKTIRTYKERIMEKTDTRNVAELITFGFRNGILS